MQGITASSVVLQDESAEAVVSNKKNKCRESSAFLFGFQDAKAADGAVEQKPQRDSSRGSSGRLGADEVDLRDVSQHNLSQASKGGPHA